MTNRELQYKLDKRKWDASKKEGRDLSGYMPYCASCKFSADGCSLPHENRESLCLCARAYKGKKK